MPDNLWKGLMDAQSERPFYLLLAEAERDVVMPTEWGTSTPDGELLQPPTP